MNSQSIAYFNEAIALLQRVTLLSLLPITTVVLRISVKATMIELLRITRKRLNLDPGDAEVYFDRGIAYFHLRGL